MMRSGEEILADIDATLDQLIAHNDVMKRVSPQALEMVEVEAVQKTQESLLARLMHMSDLLQKQKDAEVSLESIEQKMVRFGKLHAKVIGRLETRVRRAKRVKQLRVRPHRLKKKLARESLVPNR